jgi:nucleoside-diphosphate-sugar epimerase
MKTILITGAAGGIGTHLRRELAGKYRLRLSDVRPIKVLAKGESFLRADIRKLADLVRATKGVDAVVHLGGHSVEGTWGEILPANIVGCYNAFEAARRPSARHSAVCMPTNMASRCSACASATSIRRHSTSGACRSGSARATWRSW